METKKQYDSLVIVGIWNKAIFTPQWVQKYVFTNEEKIKVEYPIDNPDASLKFSSQGISLNIINQNLIFSVENPNTEKFSNLAQKAISVCRALAHTPIFCFGVNHYFECHKDEIKDKNIFDFSNFQLLQDKGYELISMRNQQTLKFKHHILNIIWSINDDKVQVEFNNHYDVSDINSFFSIFNEDILSERLEESKSYINNIYGLSVYDNDN